MECPVIVVTGGIASGKSTIAGIIAARGGTVVDCDALAHRALRLPEVKQGLADAFGRGVLTRTGAISKAGVRAAVFSSDRGIEILNSIVRPHVTRIINEEVDRRRCAFPYIVLDAVLFFHYTFKFNVDLSIAAEAPETVRIGRLMRRDGLSRGAALERIERQRYLERGWARADRAIMTNVDDRTMKRTVEEIRDEFLAKHGIIGGSDDG